MPKQVHELRGIIMINLEHSIAVWSTAERIGADWGKLELLNEQESVISVSYKLHINTFTHPE